MHKKSVSDFRRTVKGNIRHRLSDVIILMIFGRLSKCIGRTEIIEFGRHNLGKFKKMGLLRNGVPSEPTLCRIEKGIDELAFANRMMEYVETFHIELMNTMRTMEIVCIDGKAVRGTVQENGRNPDIVSAYSYNTGIVLATEACDEKSNEIKATPNLIDKLDLKGKVVTADAMLMQKAIIEKIRDKGGDFLIELKANQRALRYGVEDRLKISTPVYTYMEEPVLGHGRIETRVYRVYDGLELINKLNLKNSEFRGTTSLERIEDYRLKELIIEDLKLYKEAKLADIRERIGPEISEKRYKTQILSLEEEGIIGRRGSNRWTSYYLISSLKSN